MQDPLMTMEYSVENIVFKNEDTGFAVLQGSVGPVMVTAVGELASVEEGEELRLTGQYVEHPSFGTQFQVKVFERKLPTTARAIKKFLASGSIKGIGPVLAERIVDRFGDNTFQVIEENPACLAEIPGISPAKVKKLSEAFDQLFAMRRLMMFLEEFGIRETDSVKAWSKWGAFALDTIQKNPYHLCEEGIDVSFSVADKMAKKLSFPQDHGDRIASGVLYVLRHNARENGHTCVPRPNLLPVASELLHIPIEQIDQQIDHMLKSGQLCSCEIGKEYLFLPSFYMAEQVIADRIASLLICEPLEEELLNNLVDLEQERMGLSFAPLQRQAICEAVSNGIFILTGGPGTGKTTILNAVISILEQRGYDIAVCAPTGRAAKRLTEVSGRAATTIHRLIGVQTREQDKQEFVHHERNPLAFDVVIVDEMSMVDSMLFYHLIQALQPTCKLILTGDSNQLPSVSAGNVLRELIASDRIPCVELKEVFRQSAQSLIVTSAHDMIRGDIPTLDSVDQDFFFLSRKDPESVAQTVVDLCVRRLPKAYGFSAVEDIQVVCPSKKGVIGTVALNNALQRQINPPNAKKAEFPLGAYRFREGDKVMQVKNNYDIVWKQNDEEGSGIYNGDIGFIRSIHRAASMMEIDFDGKIASYPLELARQLELAYAITIHKSQGNEFRAVVLPAFCPKSEFYNRNLLYTGITRAKELLILVGSYNSVAHMVHQIRVNYRYTGLKEFVRRQVEEKDQG